MLACFSLAGCGLIRSLFKLPSRPAPTHQTHKPEAEESPERKVRRLEGELRTAKLDRDDARLHGARVMLNWLTGILALATVGGLVAAVFMRSRLLGYGALACAVGAMASQVTNKALDHIEVISWLTLAALAIGAAVMVWRYHHD